jgi:hypothetical protein
MSRSKNILLELLREGPPHNQLLSPLTRYLAVCENRPPESVRLSVEHRDFLRWQAGLTYSGLAGAPAREQISKDRSSAERLNAIDSASQAVTNILGSIRALIAELASEPCEWRHIHMIVDASELGALPFELARAAPGLVVEGDRLFLQQNSRVTLSRQTRRVATSVVSWPSRPRILCVIASGDLPAEAHVLALRKSIDPWIGWNDGDKGEEDDPNSAQATTSDYVEKLKRNRAREASQMMTVLVDPTLAEVSAEARRTCFTHVHILAHGAPLPDPGPGQTLYGICVRGENGKIDVVDGDRLEAALRHPRHAECAHPTVVTLATCEGANVTGGVLGPGGSAAHAIHSKGVPLVVAAQFPLSKGASVIATEMLYKGLLRGEDPRESLHSIRRQLLVAHPDTHDWASLVMYASFPDDLMEQLRKVRSVSDRLAAETAVERLGVTLRNSNFASKLAQSGTTSHDTGGSQPGSDPAAQADNPPEYEEWLKRVRADVDRLDETFGTLRSWTASSNESRVRAAGYRLLGRLALRLWDVLTLRKIPFNYALSVLLFREKKHDFASGRLPVSMLNPVELLRFAKDAYESSFYIDGSQWELWVQAVVLGWPLWLDWTDRVEYTKDVAATHNMASLLGETADRAIVNASAQRALAAAIKFEATLLLYLVHRGGNVAPPSQIAVSATMPGALEGPAQAAAKAVEPWNEELNKLFDEFVRAASPIPESYRAHAAWREMRRHDQWAKERGAPEDVQKVIQGFRTRLKNLGARHYWGPRS